MRTKGFDPSTVVDTAMNIFWKQGFAATSIQDLVDGTGLSRSSLYETFGNKHGLYQEALRRYREVTDANVLLLSGAGSARFLIRQLLLRLLEEEVSDVQQRGCLVANATLELAGHDADVARLVTQNFQALHDAFQQLLQRGQQSGEISPEKDADALAWFFVNTMQGMRVLGKGQPVEERRQSLRQVTEVALNTL